MIDYFTIYFFLSSMGSVLDGCRNRSKESKNRD